MRTNLAMMATTKAGGTSCDGMNKGLTVVEEEGVDGGNDCGCGGGDEA